MNDEPLIRLRPRKSKHGPNENPRKYTGVLRSMLRLVQMSKRGLKTRGTHSGVGSARVHRAFNQRVAVRVSYSANKNPGQWKAHGRYVARESATQGGRAADAGFNAAKQNLNISTTLDNWQRAGDERLFKIIVSPEFGDRLNLQQHTRELMKRIKRDLGTQLEWVAAVHHNTEHPHVHIAVRGIDDKGMPLRFPREYIREGMRERAEEIATEALGYRSPADAALVSDKRLPLQVTTLRQLQTVTGRVLLHTEDEQTGKRYMLIEGTDAKVHLIYHTPAIEEARKQGKLAVDNFIRIEKRFEHKKPTLCVDDLGDANALLQNSSHFHKEAEFLLRRGIRDVQSEWGGWLGQYQTRLQSELRNMDRDKWQSRGRGGLST